ncbi:MAG TPA: 3-ketoacyl-ACP reductase [Spirochaetia bacterium]|nr:3-ketoacyl-ACP reductase [Spirochaetia bacterium]
MNASQEAAAMDRKVALVTGGTRGIGLGCAEALAREGWNLAVCGKRAEPEAREALDRLRSLGADTHYLQADIGDDGSPRVLTDGVLDRFGRLDLLVNNAGVAPRERKDILEATPESYDRVMRTNLRGPYFLTQAVARSMVERKTAGCIIFISSMSASVVSLNRGEYCISKAGVGMASQLWAARLADEGISVFEVRPGIIRTDMTAGVSEKYDRLFAQGLALQKRWGTPADVGRAVAMLARGDLPYSTGQVILVDGGLTVQRL